MDTQDFTRPIFAPVILGTSRQGRASEYAAHFVFDRVSKRSDIRSDFIDIRNIRLSIDDAGESIKDSGFSATVAKADALILVVPEYNHSFPGLLKHVLDTNLKEYIHKAAGVSAADYSYFWISSTSCPSGSLTRAPFAKPALSVGIPITPGEMKTDVRLSQFLRECIYVIRHDGRLPVNNIIRLNVRRPGVFS